MTDIVQLQYRHVRGGFYLAAICVVPFLLAPVYYQGTNPNMVEPAPGRETSPGVRELPAAVPLVSPLLVTPTEAGGDSGQVLRDGQEQTSKGAKEKPRSGKVVLIDAAMCVRGLETLQDLAALAYQRTSGSGYMGVIVAGALAKQQVLDGEVPNMKVVKGRIQAVKNGKILRTEMQQGYVLTEAACMPVSGNGKN